MNSQERTAATTLKGEDIRIGWIDGLFLVVTKTGKEINGLDEVFVLRQFDDPEKALAYGAAVMDGLKLMNGGVFTPTDDGEVLASPEAMLAMTGMFFERNNKRRENDVSK